jgi:trk system potassium uptake protein TrkH
MPTISNVIGLLLIGLGAVMLVPAAVDPADAWQFFLSAVITLFCGGALFVASRAAGYRIDARQAYLLTSGAWTILPLFAALPFLLSGISLADAVFESVSGVTTTGSTVLTKLDMRPPSLLFWRAMLQWAGGVGIIVTSIAILPLLRVGGMQLFRTESSERSDKELPRAATIAAGTLWAYGGLSIACALAYRLAGMNGFDAITHAMTTVSTGGYSTHNLSMGHFTDPAIHWIAILFMLAGSIPFVLYIRLTRRGSLRSVQVRALVGFLASVIFVLTLWRLIHSDAAPFETLTAVTFNVVSVVTTTGFATTDYTEWGAFAVFVFFVLTFVGGCTGSTAGGIKFMRLIVVGKMIRIGLWRIFYPHGVFVERYEDKRLGEDVMGSVAAYLVMFFMSYLLLTAGLQLTGLDFPTSASGAVTALANVGPGIGAEIGPSGNFAMLPDAAKWLLCLGMLLGRLEFIALLVLANPAYWKPWAKPL